MNTLVDKLHKKLPQTQCRECGYDGCRPYAEAIARNEVGIDKCPPGGEVVLIQLSKITKADPAPYLRSVRDNTREPEIAKIVESQCIGCTKCIQACPVDAVIGTGKKMHTIIEAECTGCGLCVPVCPTDCIELTPIDAFHFDKTIASNRYDARNKRMAAAKQKGQRSYQDKKEVEKQAKLDYIQAALKRVQQKQVEKQHD